jgi:hypothetical protein
VTNEKFQSPGRKSGVGNDRAKRINSMAEDDKYMVLGGWSGDMDLVQFIFVILRGIVCEGCWIGENVYSG